MKAFTKGEAYEQEFSRTRSEINALLGTIHHEAAICAQEATANINDHVIAHRLESARDTAATNLRLQKLESVSRESSLQLSNLPTVVANTLLGLLKSSSLLLLVEEGTYIKLFTFPVKSFAKLLCFWYSNIVDIIIGACLTSALRIEQVGVPTQRADTGSFGPTLEAVTHGAGSHSTHQGTRILAGKRVLSL